MGQYSDSGMVALLPAGNPLPNTKYPHLTLAYFGKIKDLHAELHDEILRTAKMASLYNAPLTLGVLDIDVFGDEGEKVDVLKIDKTLALSRLQSSFTYLSVSKHPFSPHVTVGPEGSLTGDTPFVFTFDRLVVEWSDNKTIFELTKE